MNIFLFVLLGIINVVVYYFFFYYLLYYIKKDVNIAQAAGVLLFLFSLAIITCPIVLSLLLCCLKMKMPMMM